MKKLPLAIDVFREIIEDNYVYVDKTALALDLIERGKYYFLSRPRRLKEIKHYLRGYTSMINGILV